MITEYKETFVFIDNGISIQVFQTKAGKNTNPNIYIGWRRKVILWIASRYFARQDILGRITKLFHS